MMLRFLFFSVLSFIYENYVYLAAAPCTACGNNIEHLMKSNST